jgi:uncharacterized small protein (DUF1192 family)
MGRASSPTGRNCNSGKKELLQVIQEIDKPRNITHILNSRAVIAMSSLAERIFTLEEEITGCMAEREKSSTSISDKYFLTKKIGPLSLALGSLYQQRDEGKLYIKTARKRSSSTQRHGCACLYRSLGPP